MKHSQKKNRPTLGVSMIVKNEEDNLPHILDDIRGMVDEIVVVDTGSTDRTMEIAGSYGVRLGHFDWRDDFAAARNASLELMESDYILWLDADDRMPPESRRKIQAFRSRLPHTKDRAFWLPVHLRKTDGSANIIQQVRIIPNRDDVRFEGRVHEQILPTLQQLMIPITPQDIGIIHEGYGDHDLAQHKARRNLAILEQELAEGKDTPTQHFFIAMTYHAMEDNERCLEHMRRANRGGADQNWHRYSYYVIADTLLRLERPEEGLRSVTDGITLYPDSGLLHGVTGIISADLHLDTDALSHLQTAMELGLETGAFPVSPIIQELVILRRVEVLDRLGRLDEARTLCRGFMDRFPHQNEFPLRLGILELRLGNISAALACLEKAHDQTDSYQHGLWLSLAKVYAHLDRHVEAHALYREILEQPDPGQEALAGAVVCSVENDDLDTLVAALDGLMNNLSLDTDQEVESIEQLAGLCTLTARAALDHDDLFSAGQLAHAALLMDDTLGDAYLIQADIARISGDMAHTSRLLQQALTHGASAEEVSSRLTALTI